MWPNSLKSRSLSVLVAKLAPQHGTHEQTSSAIGIDFKTRQVEKDGKNFTVQLWDTAGQKRFGEQLPSSYYRSAHGIFLIFDYADKNSFEIVARWLKDILANARDDVEILLVGIDNDPAKRKVTQQNVAELASMLRANYKTVDLNNSASIEEAFSSLLNPIFNGFQRVVTAQTQQLVDKKGGQAITR